MRSRVLLLGLLWVALVAAAPEPQPVPGELPPPDLTALVPLAAAPVDKPAIAVPQPAVPESPYPIPPLPPPPLVLDPAVAKPVAPAAPPECSRLGRMFGSVSSLIECARAAYEAGEYESAVRQFEDVLNKSPEEAYGRQARYWLGESLYKLARVAEADRLFAQVYPDSPRGDVLGIFALHSSGWTALQLGEARRALEAFDGVLELVGPAAQSLVISTQHGRALALSMLGRWEEARQAWTKLLGVTPDSLAREARFWLGESLGRLGQYGAASEQIGRFVRGGPHPLLNTGLLRLGWWTNLAGRPLAAIKAYREVLASAGEFRERDWAQLGLARAMLAADDWAGAREAVRPLVERKPPSPLANPILFALAQWVASRRPADAHALDQELLAQPLSSRDRAWVLFVEGDVYHREGQQDEARTRYDLARTADPASLLGWTAALRLGRLNFEVREFGQVERDMTSLLARPIPPDLRGSALLLQGESAYYAGDYDASIAAYRRFLGEFRASPLATEVKLSIGWAELRQGNDADARQLFTDFARDLPGDPLAPDALVLAAELAARAGDTAGALDLLREVIGTNPEHPRADIARLNRAILLLRSGRPVEAQPLFRDFIEREPDSPLLGRAHAGLGVALLDAKLPAEAHAEFVTARDAGLGALALLGLGTTAIALKRWDEAEQALVAARDDGTAAVTTAAAYGLVVTAYARGARESFRKRAGQLVGESPARPGLLYALTVSAVDSQAWDEALEWAKRLARDVAEGPTAASALYRVGVGAADAKRWVTAGEALSLLRQQYPQSPLVDATFMPWAEAELETGAGARAREGLEKFVAAAMPDDPRLPHVWLMLAPVREDAGDRPGALEAYTRAGPPGAPTAPWTPALRLRFARLLVDGKRWKDARAQLDLIIKGDETAAATEAAFYEGETFRAEGNQAEAAEYFMTAAYLGPESPFGRKALLEAASTYIALKQPDAAAIAYKKLLDQPDLPSELAQRAHAGLAAIGH